MITIKSEQVVMWDVDQTLVLYGKIKKGHKAVNITCPHSGDQLMLRVHEGHLRIIKDRFSRGAVNIVWSAGGWAWAAAVVQALGLQKYVSLIMSKPCLYVDDKPATEILGPRLYLEPEDSYK